MKVKAKRPEKNLILISQLKSQLARTLADYDNLKKRADAEKGVWFEMASARVVKNILPILDNLESVQKHLQDQGLAITIVEFKKVLNEEGFTELIPVSGDSFDEYKMEAVEALEGGNPGEVAELVLSGWIGKREILRHAKVKVYGKVSSVLERKD